MTIFFFFFFNDTATTEIYTLSLHDALPICGVLVDEDALYAALVERRIAGAGLDVRVHEPPRSEEHTSELQSQSNLVCRLLLEKKKKQTQNLALVLRTTQTSLHDNRLPRRQY